MEVRLGSFPSLVILATFLISTSQGQTQPQVLLVTQPQPHYYVTKERPVSITCEAHGATSITFLCLGAPALPAHLTTFRSFDEDRGISVVRTSLQVSWGQVEGALEAGVEEYWCQCTAQDEDRFISVSSRRAVVSSAFLDSQFQESPVSQTVAPGAQSVLTCIPPLGDPVPQITWRKDGHKLKVGKDDNVVVGADDSLMIVKARPQDGGIYHCVARNPAGRRQSSLATVTVQENEVDDMEDVHVTQQPTVRAHKDTARPRAERAVRKPVFSQQPPMDIYITPSQPINLVCAVEGATRMTVRCNNQRIEPNRLVSESDRETSYIRKELTLTYPEVQNYLNTFSDPHYKCECVAWYTDESLPRKWGSVVTEGGKIYLAHLDEEFTAQPEDLTVQAGSGATLRCGAPSGQPAPQVFWVFEQQRLDPDVDNRYTVSEDGALTISSVNYNDEGRYYCVAENSMGIRQSELATLTVSEEPVAEVLEPSPSTTPGYVPTFPAVVPDVPVFTRDLEPVYFLDQNQQAKLVCTVVSADTLTYRCMQNRLNENEQVIDMKADRVSGKRLLTATTVVSLQDVQSVLQGDYTCQCVAWFIKDGGWQYNFSTLAAIRPAYIDSVFMYEPQGGLFYVGDSAEFACHPPGGQPAPQVTWLKDGVMLDTEADDNFVILLDGGLIIDRVRQQDAGEYVCVATNPAGRRESSPAVLEVYPLPDTSTLETPRPGKVTDGPGERSSTEMDGMSSTTPADDFQLSTSKSGRIIPFFTIEAVEVAYVINQEPARLTCGAVEATRLVFVCNGVPVPADKEEGAFKAVDPTTGYVFLEKSIIIDYGDLESYQGLGDYKCHCRAYYRGDSLDRWDFVAATNTTVKLAYMDRQFVEEPVQQVAELGENVELVCRPPMGNPKPTVRWVKDGFILRETNNVHVTAEGSLMFEQVALEDSGNYTCVAENILGTSSSDTVPLIVVDQGVRLTTEEPGEPEAEGEGTAEPTGEPEGEGESWDRVPTFVAEPESNYYIVRSRPVTITCQATGSEQINFRCNDDSIPQYRVQYQDMEVEGYGDVMTASIDVSREEVENYNNQRGGNDFHCQCFAQYSDPTLSEHQYVASVKGYVEVAYLKKMFPREPFNLTLQEGQFLSLPCEPPEGHPMPEVHWTLNGVRLNGGNPAPGYAYVIQSVGAADAGVYECVASNVANTRRSRPGSVYVQVGDTLVTGQPMTEGPEAEGEPDTTTPDYDVTWTTGEMTPEQNCMSIIESCTAIMPRDVSGPDSPGCRNAQRFTECVGRFLDECQGVLNQESLDAADSTKKAVEKGCGSGSGGSSGRVCQELMDCQSEYSNQQVPNADADTTPMEILCEGIHSFLRCAESAAEGCGIPQDNPDTSLSDLADWFEEYCQKVVDQDWTKECPSFAQCGLPIEQTTILSNLVQASLWCPYVEDTMQCTRQAVSDCGVEGVEDDLNSLDTMAQSTCNPSAAAGGEKEDNMGEGGGNKQDNDNDESVGHSMDEEDNAGGKAQSVQASACVTWLLSAMLLWLSWR